MKVNIPKTTVQWSDGTETTSTASGILKRILKENNLENYNDIENFFNNIDRCKLPKGMGRRVYQLLEDIVKH